MTPSIINTNNKNLNIKYNERLVKDIRKDEREKTLKEIEEIMDYLNDPCCDRVTIRKSNWNKLKEKQ